MSRPSGCDPSREKGGCFTLHDDDADIAAVTTRVGVIMIIVTGVTTVPDAAVARAGHVTGIAHSRNFLTQPGGQP